MGETECETKKKKQKKKTFFIHTAWANTLQTDPPPQKKGDNPTIRGYVTRADNMML